MGYNSILYKQLSSTSARKRKTSTSSMCIVFCSLLFSSHQFLLSKTYLIPRTDFKPINTSSNCFNPFLFMCFPPTAVSQSLDVILYLLLQFSTQVFTCFIFPVLIMIFRIFYSFIIIIRIQSVIDSTIEEITHINHHFMFILTQQQKRSKDSLAKHFFTIH